MATVKPYSDAQVRRGMPIIRVMSRVNTALYRWTSGRVGGRFLRGAPVCLVTTTGRRSGEPRTVPLLYLRDGEDIVVVASCGGMPRQPDWYRNVTDDPRVTVEIGRVREPRVARTADPAEKTALWPKLTAMYRDFDDYQARTDRDIPVVVLERVGAATGG